MSFAVTVNVDFNGVNPVNISPESFSFYEGVPWTLQFVATKGVGPFEFSATDLPAGCTFDATGLLKSDGSPLGAGIAKVTCKDLGVVG